MVHNPVYGERARRLSERMALFPPSARTATWPGALKPMRQWLMARAVKMEFPHVTGISGRGDLLLSAKAALVGASWLLGYYGIKQVPPANRAAHHLRQHEPRRHAHVH
jgi:hypothetical protein